MVSVQVMIVVVRVTMRVLMARVRMAVRMWPSYRRRTRIEPKRPKNKHTNYKKE